jgi:transcription elongation factor Elf1
MKEFNCKYCDSKNLFIKKTGNQTGLYCGNCGKWLKWLGKEELRLAEIFIKENNSIIKKYANKTYTCNDIENLKELLDTTESSIAKIRQLIGL